MDRTYYDILGVPETASFDEIKSAYREQIRFFHPDVFEGSPEVANEKTLELNEAYETLSNPEKRIRYDFVLYLRRRKAAAENPEPEEPEDLGSVEEPAPAPPPPEPTIPPNKRRFSVLSAVLILVCAILAVSTCFFYSQAGSNAQRVKSLEVENAELQKTAQKLEATNKHIRAEISELRKTNETLLDALSGKYETHLFNKSTGMPILPPSN